MGTATIHTVPYIITTNDDFCGVLDTGFNDLPPPPNPPYNALHHRINVRVRSQLDDALLRVLPLDGAGGHEALDARLQLRLALPRLHNRVSTSQLWSALVRESGFRVV